MLNDVSTVNEPNTCYIEKIAVLLCYFSLRVFLYLYRMNLKESFFVWRLGHESRLFVLYNDPSRHAIFEFHFFVCFLFWIRKKKDKQVPPRFELGSLDSKSRVLTITPWDRLLQSEIDLFCILIFSYRWKVRALITL